MSHDGGIAPSTRMGAVELSVADLDRSIAYYRRAIGLSVLAREERRVSLGAGETVLLRLVAEAGARPAHGHPGLFHFALLVPSRIALARWLAHARRTGLPLTGLSDHFVSEAIYLRDPDHHGVEIYSDRPRAVWEGGVAARMGSWRLDVDDLLGELAGRPEEPFDGLPAATTMGHVHLRVVDVPSTIGFYEGALGMELMATFGDQAAFLAAGGYHHHVGANTWETTHDSPAPTGTARLRHADLVLPSVAARDAVVTRLEAAGHTVEPIADGPLVRDPSGNELRLVAAAPPPAAPSATLPG